MDCFELGLDDLRQFLQALQLVVVHGDADMADDLLSDLVAVANRADDLDGLPGAVGGVLDAYEHGGSLAPPAPNVKPLF